MGKKLNTNPKALAARERKEQQQAAQKSKAAQEADDRAWQENPTKSAAQAQERAQRRAEKAQAAAERKAANRALAAEDEQAVASSLKAGRKAGGGKKGAGAPVKKTRAQIEIERRRLAKEKEEQQRREAESKAGAVVPAERTVDLAPLGNKGGDPDELSARNVDDALDVLATARGGAAATAAASTEIDMHPERRFKAAFAAYVEDNMERARQEYPGIKRGQLTNILRKEFDKSPLNPFVAQREALSRAASKN
eukprot:m.37119 g.37119  ORF g.37119 m.37119 type:complete len:252 (+) comp11074_c0_seq2:269-1024(+)